MRTTLGSICSDISYGVTTSAADNSSGPRLLRITDIGVNGVDWNTVPGCFISESEQEKGVLEDGDIVIARTGGTVGKSYLVENPPRAVFASYLIRLKPERARVLPEYLNLFLGSAWYWNQLRSAAMGAAQPNVNSTTLSAIEIDVPSVEEQKRIISPLNAQLTEVETARLAALSQLQDVALLPTRILNDVFDGISGDPATLDEVLINIQAGKSFQTAETLAGPDALGVLKVSAVTWTEFRPSEAKALRDTYDPADSHRVKNRDFIISRANTKEFVGAVVLVDRDYPNRLLSDKTLRLVVDENRVCKEYLLYALRTSMARRHIEHFATGTSDSMRNISQGTITSIPLCLPELNEQRRLATQLKQRLKEVREVRTAVEAQLRDIEQLPNRILAQAFEN